MTRDRRQACAIRSKASAASRIKAAAHSHLVSTFGFYTINARRIFVIGEARVQAVVPFAVYQLGHARSTLAAVAAFLHAILRAWETGIPRPHELTGAATVIQGGIKALFSSTPPDRHVGRGFGSCRGRAPSSSVSEKVAIILTVSVRARDPQRLKAAHLHASQLVQPQTELPRRSCLPTWLLRHLLRRLQQASRTPRKLQTPWLTCGKRQALQS